MSWLSYEMQGILENAKVLKNEFEIDIFLCIQEQW
jgi:hypothetical protein